MATRTAPRASQPQRKRRRLSPVPSLVAIGALLIMLGAATGSGIPFTLGVLSILTAALVGVTR
jgi:fatty acid desaturase